MEAGGTGLTTLLTMPTSTLSADTVTVAEVVADALSRPITPAEALLVKSRWPEASVTLALTVIWRLAPTARPAVEVQLWVAPVQSPAPGPAPDMPMTVIRLSAGRSEE